MTKFSRDDVLKLARLARLKLTDAEVEQFAGELTEILSYVEQLGAVDTTNLDPTYQVTGLTNVTRPDAVINYGPSQEELLKNAPAREGDYIRVKRMLA